MKSMILASFLEINTFGKHVVIPFTFYDVTYQYKLATFISLKMSRHAHIFLGMQAQHQRRAMGIKISVVNYICQIFKK